MSFDLHTHTFYSDGIGTPEETVMSAVDKGLSCVGISDHSYTFFDESYCIKKDDIPKYISEISSLKAKYRGRIDVLCGVEQDYYSTSPTDGFDYVIGSVHYIFADGVYIPIDETESILSNAAKTHFGGDFYALAREYFRVEADVAEKTHADLIGHFDLISKFNKNGALFDENDARYVSAWTDAADALLPLGVPFEINTGAVYKGYRVEPYPSAPIIEYIRSHGGRFVLSSDCHTPDKVAWGFDKYSALLI